MKKIVVLTGAGVSAESGMKTFRDSGGLWENHKVTEVATPEAWESDQGLVLRFYNERRKQLYDIEPNPAHYALASLEDKYDVQIITQNIDDLHERAGSTNVLHLHGELKKAQSCGDPEYICDIEGWELNEGDRCPKGHQLRPHVVWFGEPVPNIIPAAEISSSSDIYLVVGTSLVVYPAAGLLHYVPDEVPKYIVDPKASQPYGIENLTIIKKRAGEGMPELVKELMADLG